MLHGNMMISLSSPSLKYCCYIASSAAAASSCPRALLWPQLLLPLFACAVAGDRVNVVMDCCSSPRGRLIPPWPWDWQPEAHSNNGTSKGEYTGQNHSLDFNQKFEISYWIYLGIFFFLSWFSNGRDLFSSCSNNKLCVSHTTSCQCCLTTHELLILSLAKPRTPQTIYNEFPDKSWQLTGMTDI